MVERKLEVSLQLVYVAVLQQEELIYFAVVDLLVDYYWIISDSIYIQTSCERIIWLRSENTIRLRCISIFYKNYGEMRKRYTIICEMSHSTCATRLSFCIILFILFIVRISYLLVNKNIGYGFS